MQQYADNVIPVIPTLDTQTHSVERPFCFATPDCPCHEDTNEVNKVNGYYQNGLMTANEATKFVKGD